MHEYHVTRLDPDIDQAQLQEYLQSFVPDVKAEKLTTRRSGYSSFKVSVPSNQAEKILVSDIWPDGVIVNRFFPDDNEVIVFPPDDGEVTDEDSGEEDNVVINNLPGAQVRTLAEVVLPNIEDVSDFDSEDDLPLSRFGKRQQVSRPKKKQTEELAWIKTDITPNMPS
nr:unnamed protein product [Callosobruchus chinensis]